ncbi:MAG: pentapeptide repeat-containing protein [Deltaproteobacteria bacterium]|nr:pentapeptide repeat-containing protein [Deltaproteobacteria bacterium]
MRPIAAVLLLGACAADVEVRVSSTEQMGVNMQGVNMQGVNMQGVNMQGVNMQGFALDGLTLTSAPLSNARVAKGELVANRPNGSTVSGTAMTGARLFAHGVDASGATRVVEYRIAAVTAESASYDPTRTGNTFLYNIEQWVADTSSWQPACGPDSDGRRVAIPIAATFDDLGDRHDSSTMFTFGCTTGVIAKCYRWGYRPWLTGYGAASFSDLHWTCTRAARADYCGDGTPHTKNGTVVNIWDRLPAPGPIQKHGLLAPLGMVFEAGWNTSGAVCLSRARWLLDATLANLCPDRLVPPGLLGATVCDTVADVLGQDPNALLFNESYLNLL